MYQNVQDSNSDGFAWVAQADIKQVRKRLQELQQVRRLLQQEEKLVHARRQELNPSSGRYLKYAYGPAPN